MMGQYTAWKGREEIHAEYGWGNLFQSSHVEDRKEDGRMMLRCILKK
jgi:hypothetical protein